MGERELEVNYFNIFKYIKIKFYRMMKNTLPGGIDEVYYKRCYAKNED